MNIAEHDISNAWKGFCEKEEFDIRFLEFGKIFVNKQTTDEFEFKQYAYLRGTRFHPKIKIANAMVMVNRESWEYWRKQNIEGDRKWN